jgi:hypothetical protein
MDYFAGLDVSVKETSICIVDDAGKIVREARVASEPVIGGAALLTAVPYSLQWSQNNLGPVLTLSRADAQTAGMERRQARRTARRERRETRREARRAGRETRRAVRRGTAPQ